MRFRCRFGIVNPKKTKVAATGFGAWMDQHAAKYVIAPTRSMQKLIDSFRQG